MPQPTMPSEYFETQFRTDAPVDDWPPEFVIISAYATTGHAWSPEKNAEADAALRADLESRCNWLARVTGYSPTTDHSEPSWAVGMPFAEACDLGSRFEQDAIYAIRGDDLFVSYCDARRALVHVGRFGAHLTARESE